VYEFFLFNSLYDVDWENTGTGPLVFHVERWTKRRSARVPQFPEEAREAPTGGHLSRLRAAARRRGGRRQLDTVTPECTDLSADGDAFFRRVREIRGSSPRQTHLGHADDKATSSISCANARTSSTSCATTSSMARKRSVRSTRRSRSGVSRFYDLFLKGLTSLFFLAAGKDTGLRLRALPLTERTLPGAAREWCWTARRYSCIAARVMRIGDSRLVTRFTKVFPRPPATARPASARSLLPERRQRTGDTDPAQPAVLHQFHFFERHRVDKTPPPIAGVSSRLPGVQLSRVSPRWTPRGHRECLEFEFNDVPRRVHWVHADNLAFLDEPVDLRFYFHRRRQRRRRRIGATLGLGATSRPPTHDSDGSGLSLPDRRRTGGLDTQPVDVCHVLNMPFIERYRTYQAGTIHP